MSASETDDEVCTLNLLLGTYISFFSFFGASTNQCQDRALSRALSQCGGRSPGGNSSIFEVFFDVLESALLHVL